MVAAGQEDKARILPVGHGCLRPGGGKAAPAPPQALQAGTSYQTWQEPSPHGAQQRGPGVVSVWAAAHPGSGPQGALGRCWQVSTHCAPHPCSPPLLSCTHPERGGPGACSAPAGLLVRGSLVRMYLTHSRLLYPHSPLSQVPSRCTTEPSNSLSVSLGPSSRLHLQGMEWAGGRRWDFPQSPTFTPLCMSINLTHHCPPSSPHVSAPSCFSSPSVLTHLQPHRYVPNAQPPITPTHKPSAPTRVRLRVPAHPKYTRTFSTHALHT